MELQTIRQITSEYGVSRRMLCYYEEIGLIKSRRRDDYAYRVYDGDAVKRLQQIVILRKLQIPMKHIKNILNNQDAVEVVEIFRQNIDELDEEITALSTLRAILRRFVDELIEKADVRLKLDLLNDKSMIALVDSLSFAKHKIKEKISADELNRAAEQLPKRTDVRIVYLPPVAIASVQSSNGTPEWDAYEILANFAKDTDLLKIKPDARSFGFDCMVDGKEGYEAWATIPEKMEVKAPFIKKKFPGGLYACHTRAFSHLNYDENKTLREWISASDIFEIDNREPVGMFGHIEEQFVFETYMRDDLKRFDYLHIDFFIPVKKIAAGSKK